ncbi:MAG: hypothetical protein U5Q44_02205 [Dehalococcoidia bacterium]|nr:hypothetical protein [Dehalococcoidia bacterium]
MSSRTAARISEGANDGDGLVAGGPGEQLATDDAHDEQADGLGRGDDAGRRGGRFEAGLDEGRQVGDDAEHGHAEHEDDEVGPDEGAVAEEMERHDGFRRAALLGDEGAEEHDGSCEEAQDLRRSPGVVVATEFEREQEGDGRGGEKRGSQEVDRRLAAVDPNFGQRVPDRGKGDHGHGQVDEEDPAPANGVGEEAAEDRPDHAREAEDAREQPHVAAALDRREEVTGGREHGRKEDAAANALEGPKDDEGFDAGSETTEGGGNAEDNRCRP